MMLDWVLSWLGVVGCAAWLVLVWFCWFWLVGLGWFGCVVFLFGLGCCLFGGGLGWAWFSCFLGFMDWNAALCGVWFVFVWRV